MSRIWIILSLSTIALAANCNLKKSANKPREQEPNAEKTADLDGDKGEALQVIDVVVGKGEEALAQKTVRVNYVGMFKDGERFDSSYERAKSFSFTIGSAEVISGWEQGLVGMRVGGTRKLIVPPQLAYGSRGISGVIPPSTDLVFVINLLEVKPEAKAPL